MYVSNPFLIGKIELLPELALNTLFWILLTVFIIDNIVSTNVISYVGKTTKEIGKDLDNTEEITKKVKETLLGKSALYSRLLNAYPKIQSIKVKLKKEQEKIKRQVKEQKEELKESVKQQREEIKQKIENISDNQKEKNQKKEESKKENVDDKK